MSYKEALTKWQEATLPDYLAADLEKYTPDQQEDAFYQNLSFGTAGMRGVLGAGTNRMNVFHSSSSN